jgi:acyl carrier protein
LRREAGMSAGKKVSTVDKSNEDVAEKVRNLVAEHLHLNSAHVLEQSDFLEDFGIDWLDRLELVIVVEERFGIDIADDFIDRLAAVGDLIRVVEANASIAARSRD